MELLVVMVRRSENGPDAPEGAGIAEGISVYQEAVRGASHSDDPGPRLAEEFASPPGGSRQGLPRFQARLDESLDFPG